MEFRGTDFIGKVGLDASLGNMKGNEERESRGSQRHESSYNK
jgi:hypothetical protein